MQMKVSALTRTSSHWLEKTWSNCYLDQGPSDWEKKYLKQYTNRWTNKLALIIEIFLVPLGLFVNIIFLFILVTEANWGSPKRTERFHPTWIFQGCVLLCEQEHLCSHLNLFLLTYHLMYFPQDSLTNNGVMVDYLHILREMKTHVKQVQDFLEAHINFLEELSKDQPTQESDKGCKENRKRMKLNIDTGDSKS